MITPLLMCPLLLSVQDTVSPQDPRIVTIGRFASEPGKLSCQWSASEVRLIVQGPKLEVVIENAGNDYLQAVVDGTARDVIDLQPGENTYTLNLAGVESAVHGVRLIKRTEPLFGIVTYKGFRAPGGSLLRGGRRKRTLEVVGDSITCGFGNEGPDQNAPFKAETENAWLTYGVIAGEEVGADTTLVAWSGRKMWPDNTMPEIYDRILPTQPEPIYDFNGPKPDVYVVNLATNDFGQKNPPEAEWTAAYEAFVRRLWKISPNARIYAAIGSMMSDNYPQGNKALSTLRGYLQRLEAKVSNPKFKVLEFEVQKMEDGIGSSWHPNVVTHRKMAAVLVSALKRDLGW